MISRGTLSRAVASGVDPDIVDFLIGRLEVDDALAAVELLPGHFCGARVQAYLRSIVARVIGEKPVDDDDIVNRVIVACIIHLTSPAELADVTVRWGEFGAMTAEILGHGSCDVGMLDALIEHPEFPWRDEDVFSGVRPVCWNGACWDRLIRRIELVWADSRSGLDTAVRLAAKVGRLDDELVHRLVDAGASAEVGVLYAVHTRLPERTVDALMLQVGRHIAATSLEQLIAASANNGYEKLWSRLMNDHGGADLLASDMQAFLRVGSMVRPRDN